ncbi:unnamed protein product [Rotaria sordida]|uniref:Major facilitator superfamily (MFS) profile domain-containing protein n=1 Tax=Rotaria sordida TaxID=392033 RepID=A0A814XB55_9BILA|nr:unnamed protein product [Rotaria sordida]CAF3625847.1 unnamed protein product [Rotaria sordida]
MTSGGATNSAVPGPVVPDGGWGWIIVFASLMIHFIMDGITYSMGDVFLRPMMENLNKTRGPVSTIFGILPAITLATGPIATIFTNTYGCRKVTMVGACLAAAGFLASYFWANIWFYYLAIGIIGGIGFGLIYLPAIVSVGFYFESKRSFAMGIAVCGSGLGTLVFPAVMPYIINAPLWFDYEGALLLEAAVIFICVIFGGLMVPLPQEPSEIRRVERKARAEAKRQALKAGTTTSPNDEQQNQLLPTNQQSEIPLEEVSIIPRESTAAVPVEQEYQSDNKRRVSQSDVKKNDLYINNRSDKTLSRSHENVSKTVTTDIPVVVSRKDAVYQGSLHNIPLYNEDTNEYHRQMITTSDMTNETMDETIKKVQKKSFFSKIVEQIDLSLLKDAAFALFAISNFLTSLGFNVPYNFANDLAADAQVIEHKRHWIIMSIGIANCFGRVIIGYLADRRWVNRLTLYNTTLIIAGIATMFAPFCNYLVQTHIIYAGLFGFFSGGYVGLTSIIIVDLVGVDKLSDAFGVLLLFQGVAVAIGTPIVGTMRDAFSGFDRPYLWPYLIFGGSILLSGLILFAIPVLKRRKERRQKPTQHQLQMGVLSFSKQNLSTPEQQQQL